jgi:GlcNAc-PI de-N-acetylase
MNLRNLRNLWLVLLAIPLLYVSPAHSEIDRAELHQTVLDLTSPWTVMCVAAHPDDEDGSTLTVLRRKYGMHTVSLFSTFGEGGQNAVGPELYEELGVIRAHETLAAAEVQGSEPHFLGFVDFGFSKSAEETFRIWGGEKELLRRMVLQIRLLRPDVIITNHDTTRPNDIAGLRRRCRSKTVSRSTGAGGRVASETTLRAFTRSSRIDHI